MKYLLVRAESAHWCGYTEDRIVLVEDHVVACAGSLDLSGFEDYMREYIGEPDDDEASDWDGDDYAAVNYEVMGWCVTEHYDPKLYQVLEGYDA